jgi:hypothetical protein
MGVDVGMKVWGRIKQTEMDAKKVGQGEAKRQSRTGRVIVVVNEHRCAQAASRVQPGLVVRYAHGHSRIRGLLEGHRVRPRGDARASLPFLKSIHANEIGNGSVSANVVVRAMVSEVHGVGRDTLPG